MSQIGKKNGIKLGIKHKFGHTNALAFDQFIRAWLNQVFVRLNIMIKITKNYFGGVLNYYSGCNKM